MVSKMYGWMNELWAPLWFWTPLQMTVPKSTDFSTKPVLKFKKCDALSAVEWNRKHLIVLCTHE